MTFNPPLREVFLAEIGDDDDFTARSSSDVMSPAELTLQRIQMQATSSAQSKDAAQLRDLASDLPPKDKPRLLLMGQRR